MAVMKVRTAPDPVLLRKTKRVNKVDASLQRLIDDMFDTMYSSHGVGLAANQVGIPLRVLVMGIPDPENEGKVQEYALINAEFVKLWKAQPKRPLPFRFGYPDSNKRAHLMVTRPKAAP